MAGCSIDSAGGAGSGGLRSDQWGLVQIRDVLVGVGVSPLFALSCNGL